MEGVVTFDGIFISSNRHDFAFIWLDQNPFSNLLLKRHFICGEHFHGIIIMPFGFIASKLFLNIWPSNLSILRYLMKVIPESRRVH
jgi:hypothetical protein